MQINGVAQGPNRTISLSLRDNNDYWVILDPSKQALYLNSTGRLLDRDVRLINYHLTTQTLCCSAILCAPQVELKGTSQSFHVMLFW